MKLEPDDAQEEKDRWKLLRTDYFGKTGGEIIGTILSANEETGVCEVQVDGNKIKMDLGPGGLRILARGRR